MPALAVRLDPRHEGDDAVDHPAEVDAEHPVPVLVGRVGDVVEEVDAGVVAEDVHVAEGALGLVRGSRERVAVGHVELDRMDVAAELGLASSRWSGRMSAIATFIPRREGSRHSQPDAAATARDERDLALDLAHRRGTYSRAGMAATTVRADVVGGLLRAEYLREARDVARAGSLDAGELHALEDKAVLEAIALQESAGIEAITTASSGGRAGSPSSRWSKTPSSRRRSAASSSSTPPPAGAASGRPGRGPRRHLGPAAGGAVRHAAAPGRARHRRRRVLVPEGACARARQVTIPAPSWSRIFWHPEYSTDAYPTSDDFIEDIARLTREHIVDRLVELAGLHPAGRAQLRPVAHRPGQPRGLRGARARHGARAGRRCRAGQHGLRGPDGRHARDAHVPRRTRRAAMWAATGGYEVISSEVFPRLTNLDRLLLEYDTDRAGGFAPLATSSHTTRSCSGW